MKAYKHLVVYLIKKGFLVSVWDGEEFQVKNSAHYEPIIEAIESVEEAELHVKNGYGKEVGWARVSAYGLADDETVIDSTTSSPMGEWWEIYETFTKEKGNA